MAYPQNISTSLKILWHATTCKIKVFLKPKNYYEKKKN